MLLCHLKGAGTSFFFFFCISGSCSCVLLFSCLTHTLHPSFNQTINVTESHLRPRKNIHSCPYLKVPGLLIVQWGSSTNDFLSAICYKVLLVCDHPLKRGQLDWTSLMLHLMAQANPILCGSADLLSNYIGLHWLLLAFLFFPLPKMVNIDLSSPL